MIDDAVTLRLAELSMLVRDDDSLDTTLERVAELAVEVIDGCDSCSVTMQAAGMFLTATSTDAIARVVDADQYRVNDGPCLDAIREGRVNRVDEVSAERRWPAFCRLAEQHGICSFLAVPLEVRGEVVGALNLYSRAPRGFDRLDEELARLFRSQAAIALANAHVFRSTRELADQLQQAMSSRAVIEQAKGILMAQHRCDPATAFALLTGMSQSRNLKLREVAAQVVASVI